MARPMADLWPSLHKQKPDRVSAEVEIEVDLEDTCPICDDATHIQIDDGATICTACGTLLDIPLETGAEYRWFSSDNGVDPSRCGFPLNHLMPESSLGTMILANTGNKLMRRIKRYHMWNMMPYRERTLWTIFEGLQVRAANAGVSTAVIEETKELFAQLTMTTSCRGQVQRDAMLAACLWEALKRHDTPRMPKDIADMFNLPLKYVTKGIKSFQNLLAHRAGSLQTGSYANPGKQDKKETQEDSEQALVARSQQRRAVWQKTVARTTTYEDFIAPYLTNLSVPVAHASALEHLVRHVCSKVEELGVVPENTPPSLTASVIAFCCVELGLTLDHGDIAKTCGVSPVTIQKCIKRLQPWKEKLLVQ